MINLLAKDKVWSLCGGRHKLYQKALEDFLKNLSSFADLVFFEDGPPLTEKLMTNIRRRNENYKRSIDIIDMVYDGQSLDTIVESFFEIPRLTTFLNMIEETIRKFGRLIVTVTRECDTELARFANNDPSVLAIVANDTDFLIFSGTWKYFSLIDIDLEHLTTIEYSRLALRKHLDLNDKQLFILSTLGGNDIIKREEVYQFHSKNCGTKAFEKFPWLASYIKNSLPMQFYPLLDAIAKNVLCDNRQVTKDRIHDSLAQYATVRFGLIFTLNAYLIFYLFPRILPSSIIVLRILFCITAKSNTLISALKS